ncbi:MAG TPA: DNRLRE domain-containing protein [Kofleriaceae bacterium]|nr:DNRLRE domain-containing protein [Kofleriaceae bacterium]
MIARKLLYLPLFFAGIAACTGESARINATEQHLATCVTVPASADAMLSSASPSSMKERYGARPVLRASDHEAALLRFDLGAIPQGAAIESATLKISASLAPTAGPTTISVHRVQAPWSEAAVTYESFSQAFDPQVIGALTVDGPHAHESVNLTSTVQGWQSGASPNHGVLLTTSASHETTFVSREGAAAPQQPTLEVCYTHLTDGCTGNPCQNGGTCTSFGDNYVCSCPAGFEGTNCEINTDDCAASPCLNGGTCTDGINSYTCQCASDWGGPTCDIDLNTCAQHPCQNGGTCTNGAGTYTCTCAPGYGGTNCQIDLDDCAPNPCQNGGACTDGVASYTCSCPIGYTGTNCEINVDDCSGDPCQNGGTCTDGVNGYTCSCLAGYSGANCEIDIDDCASGPCQNGGTCTDGINSYACACPAGFMGTNCEINIDDCASAPCQNGGTCIDGINSFTCQCTIDWVGPLCQTNACEDQNPCTLDDNTPAGCTNTSNAGDPACRAAQDSIASGAFHSCAIREGGKIYCWGMRDLGRLGNGSTTTGYVLTPVQVTGITDAVAIDAGYDHACAVRANGTVACWGDNLYGQLGTGTTVASSVPVAVNGITDAKEVATARNHTCVLRASGELRCFGRGIEGQLGQGVSASSLAPVKVIDNVDLVGPTATPQSHAPIPWIGVAATEYFTCGLRASGQVLCWGSNGNGQLGFGATGNRNQPALVASFSDAIAFAAGRTHACAVRATGNVACWGSSFALGRTGADLLVPVLIGNTSNPFANAITVTASGDHTCATTTFGRTWCWGQSSQGELAQTLGSSLPVAIPGAGLVDASVVTSSGFCHSCTLLENGTLKCWGSDPIIGSCRSQLGWGTTSGSLTPVTTLLP